MGSKRILIVDDDPTVGRILLRIFERSGFVVVTALNGKQALTQLSNTRFDAMITDIDMPQMNGRELCQHLLTGGAHLPDCVFIITSRSEEEERSWVAEFPDATLLEKPVSPKRILQLVRERLNTLHQLEPRANGSKAA